MVYDASRESAKTASVGGVPNARKGIDRWTFGFHSHRRLGCRELFGPVDLGGDWQSIKVLNHPKG
jgi:hypothetical protein